LLSTRVKESFAGQNVLEGHLINRSFTYFRP
jgi:hypothetical protein